VSYFLLLDIGGTDIKTSIYRTSTGKLGQISRSATPGFLKTSNQKKEIDPSMYINRIIKILQRHKAESLNEKCDGILISGQMGGWIGTDKKDNPQTNLISWQDAYSDNAHFKEQSFFSKFNESLNHNWFELTGRECRIGLPIISYAARRHNDDIKIARFHTLLTWTASQLSEDYRFSSHETDFASTGLFNLKKQSIDLFHFDRILENVELPRVTKNIQETGFSNLLNCPIFVAVGDQQASILGAELIESRLVINIGTGGQVAQLLKEIEPTKFQLRPYFFDLYIETKTHLTAGRAISEIVENLNNFSDKKLKIDDFLSSTSPKLQNHRELERAQSIVNQMQTLINSGYELEDLKSIFIYNIIDEYTSIIREFTNHNIKTVIFAGRVGKNFVKLQQTLESEMKFQVKIANSEETTIKGLSKLAELLYLNS